MSFEDCIQPNQVFGATKDRWCRQWLAETNLENSPEDKPIHKLFEEYTELDAMKYWLHMKECQLSYAQALFGGREISIIYLDPVGYKFPRNWWAHLVRYEPGVGLVKGSRNKAYMGLCEPEYKCVECDAFRSLDSLFEEGEG